MPLLESGSRNSRQVESMGFIRLSTKSMLFGAEVPDNPTRLNPELGPQGSALRFLDRNPAGTLHAGARVEPFHGGFDAIGEEYVQSVHRKLHVTVQG